MSESVQFNADLSLYGAMVFAQQVTEFPIEPSIGTFVLKDQCLYGYIRIGGLETWYPFASKTNSYIHTQALPALSWTVNHGLGSQDIWHQVKDAQGRIITVGATHVNDNTFTLHFTTAITGTCVVVAPTTIDVPQIKATNISIGAGGEVVIDASGVTVNGERVLTDAVIADDIATAINTHLDDDDPHPQYAQHDALIYAAL